MLQVCQSCNCWPHGHMWMSFFSLHCYHGVVAYLNITMFFFVSLWTLPAKAQNTKSSNSSQTLGWHTCDMLPYNPCKDLMWTFLFPKIWLLHQDTHTHLRWKHLQSGLFDGIYGKNEVILSVCSAWKWLNILTGLSLHTAVWVLLVTSSGNYILAWFLKWKELCRK